MSGVSGDMTGESPSLASIVAETTEDIFDLAGGFGFTDEIAVKLSERWKAKDGPVIVSALDLAWLIDGYARARLSHPGSSLRAGSTSTEPPKGDTERTHPR